MNNHHRSGKTSFHHSISDDSATTKGDYPDSLDNSSNSSSCLSLNCNNDVDAATSSKGRRARSSSGRPLLEKQQSESFADINGNSKNSASSAKRQMIPIMMSSAVERNMDSAASCYRNEKTVHESKECAKGSAIQYLTPTQRREKEVKEMKKEITRLYQELTQKEERIFQLQLQLDEQARDFQDDINKKSCQLASVSTDQERLATEQKLEKQAMEEELARMDEMFTQLKVKQKLQEDQFQERFLEMYRRGQKAALFEREQELEMVASSKQPKVTVKELTRKLSRTESELAKWQTLQRDEAYNSVEKPETDADVTLSFLKDSFYHFVCDSTDCLRHFRAIVEIFRYSDRQMSGLRKAVTESKEFSKMFKKEVVLK